MLRIRLQKMEYSGIHCDNPKCIKSEKCIDANWNIKVGSPYLTVQLQSIIEYYCKDCIDFLYKEVKPMMNSDLWLFS